MSTSAQRLMDGKKSSPLLIPSDSQISKIFPQRCSRFNVWKLFPSIKGKVKGNNFSPRYSFTLLYLPEIQNESSSSKIYDSEIHKNLGRNRGEIKQRFDIVPFFLEDRQPEKPSLDFDVGTNFRSISYVMVVSLQIKTFDFYIYLKKKKTS